MPRASNANYAWLFNQARELPLRDRNFGCRGSDIGQGSAYEPIGICVGDMVGVNVDITADSKMAALLDNMRAAATEANKANGGRIQRGLTIGSEKALPLKSTHLVCHPFNGVPTSTNSLMILPG